MMRTQRLLLRLIISCLSLLHTVFSLPTPSDRICASATWNRNGVTVAGGHGLGSALNQLNYPNGVFVADDDTIYVADTNNNRVIKWSLGAASGQVIVGDDDQKQLGQITKAVVDKNGSVFVCDRDHNRVLQFVENDKEGQTIIENISCWGLALDQEGSLYASDLDENRIVKWPGNQIVAGGNGKGNAMNKLSSPYQLFLDYNQTIYVADRGNNRVMKWAAGATEGMVAFESKGFGNADDQLYKPMAVTVDNMNTMYVVEYINLRVMRWFEGAKSGNVIIGGQGYGSGANQLYFPRDLAFDRHGNLYVADTNNHRIQMFAIDKSSCATSELKNYFHSTIVTHPFL